MTWARLDDGFADHPKIVGLSDAAFRQHVTAICYAARHSTDGHVPKGAAFVRPPRSRELIAAGLWHDETDGTYTIHDFLSYNKSRSEVMATRQANATAGAKGALSRWHHGQDGPVPDPYPTRKPDPDPHPHPTSGSAAAADSLTACVQAYDSMMGTMATTPTICRKIGDWLEANSGSAYDLAEWFGSACDKAALQDKRSLGYVFGVLKREAAEGREDRRPKAAPNGAAAATHSCVGLAIKCMSCEAQQKAVTSA